MDPLCVFALLAQHSLRQINNSLYLTNKRLPRQVPLRFRVQVQSRVIIFHIRRKMGFLAFWILSGLILV